MGQPEIDKKIDGELVEKKAFYLDIPGTGIIKWICPVCKRVWDEDRFESCPDCGFIFIKEEAICLDGKGHTE